MLGASSGSHVRAATHAHQPASVIPCWNIFVFSGESPLVG